LDLEPLKIDRGPRLAQARRGPRRSPWFGRLIALAVVVGLAVVFWKPLVAWTDRLRLPTVRVIQVTASSPLVSTAVQGTSANGYIVARVRAALSADTPGRIVEMNVKEGSVVKKGDVVARLFSDEYRALYERAEADLELAKASVVSRQAAAELTVSHVDRARADESVSVAELADAQAALRIAEIDVERWSQLVADNIAAQERKDTTEAVRDGAKARVQRAEAVLTGAREGVRAAELEQSVAGKQLAEAEALLPVKAAERDQAKATLDKTEVRAPFDGIVVLKDAEVGEVVSPNAVGAQSRGSVATMVDFATLEVQVEVPETNLAAVREGAPARIFLDAYPESAYEGSVLRIWPTANRQKATVEVRVGFDAPDARLRPEMGARVVFLGEEAEAAQVAQGNVATEPVILIPRSAVVAIDGQDHVFVLERDLARARAVVLGEERSGRVVVREGLHSGERIVDAPPARLEDGDRVQEEG